MNLKTRNSPLTEESLENFKPVRMVEVEIGQLLPVLDNNGDQAGLTYSVMLLLVRLHGKPLGMIEIELPPQGLSPQAYADQIWHELSGEINLHLLHDGLSIVEGLDGHGISAVGTPKCARARQAFLESAPFASVVIATRDRTEWLKPALDSVLASDYPDFEIIVVDNAPSTDATARLILEEYVDTGRVRYVREERPGLSVAHNRGILEVRGSYVAITDDDVLVDRYWLAELMRGFSATNHVGCVTGLILPVDLRTAAQFWFEQYGGFNKGFKQKIYDLHEYRPDDLLYPYTAGKFGTGANMAFRTNVLLEMGGFDPATGIGTLTFGGDDLAAFFDVIQNGYRLVYQPDSLVHHWHRSDYAGLRQQIFGYGVGLTAFIMKTLIDRPGSLLGFLSRLPYGLFFALSDRSPKNSKKRRDYPKELTRLERLGMLYGPFAYLRSRWLARRFSKQIKPYHPQGMQPATFRMPFNKGDVGQ